MAVRTKFLALWLGWGRVGDINYAYRSIGSPHSSPSPKGRKTLMDCCLKSFQQRRTVRPAQTIALVALAILDMQNFCFWSRKCSTGWKYCCTVTPQHISNWLSTGPIPAPVLHITYASAIERHLSTDDFTWTSSRPSVAVAIRFHPNAVAMLLPWRLIAMGLSALMVGQRNGRVVCGINPEYWQGRSVIAITSSARAARFG